MNLKDIFSMYENGSFEKMEIPPVLAMAIMQSIDDIRNQNSITVNAAKNPEEGTIVTAVCEERDEL